MKNDLLDAELSPVPSTPLRGVRAALVAAPLIAVALASSAGCETVGVSDAGTHAEDVFAVGRADAGLTDVPLLTVDVGVSDAGDASDRGP